jgi:hypothetical protein
VLAYKNTSRENLIEGVHKLERKSCKRRLASETSPYCDRTRGLVCSEFAAGSDDAVGPRDIDRSFSAARCL